ncbi:ABC-F family ATP-binding cassette domain-containing protein [Harryflintia acetispora]|uniref:ABC-F family ATP-binding cassette domain-containing protein n=1 Tax=Harryflintia acetispora TaxID=1849041 RepID=UPI0018991EC5|nr:ABC-F family ATP-binding cassette domain-containing protein [Harryflintia acetispora]
MNLLTAQQITKSYGVTPLLDGVTLGIGDNEKIGVIGQNGAGKSTLLKIIAGVEEPDAGEITKMNGLHIGYLPQNPDFRGERSVLLQAMAGIEQQNREAAEYECKAILTRLGVNDLGQKVGELSGGQKKRVALAAALVTQVDLLILDEPTNHIDNEMIEWLEDYLRRYKGALLMITHDRYFLDRVTNRIVEVAGGSLYSYEANYSGFLSLKAQREESLAASARKRQALLRKELAWIQRGAKARGTKARFRVERFEELSAQPAQKKAQGLELRSLSSRLGKKIIEIEGIFKSYGERTLIKDFSYNLLRDDRLGLIGPNGCGKSTLLKIILGLVSPDSGQVEKGATVKIGYFSQECGEMDPSQRVIDYIKDTALNIQTPDGVLSASQMLETFLFTPDMQYTAVGKLSGGERRRLYLLRILMDAPNVLLLDEPTNDLDIETLTVLEDYLDTFPGAVIAVSHDRYFLDRVARQVFVFEDGGVLTGYVGGYSDYLSCRKEEPERGAPARKAPAAGRQRERKLRLSFKEQRELETIDGEIAALEEALQENERQLAEQASNYAALQELTAEKEGLQAQLDEKMERWVYLNDLAQRIAEQDS